MKTEARTSKRSLGERGNRAEKAVEMQLNLHAGRRNAEGARVGKRKRGRERESASEGERMRKQERKREKGREEERETETNEERRCPAHARFTDSKQYGRAREQAGEQQ
eukprot:12044479-Alexandrium_andersonii.AAC.1